jgi:cell division protease FtsH
LVLNDVSSGAGDDLKKATELVRKMVCQWGMSETLGPMTFRQGEEHPFLGREIAQQRDFSEEPARQIDEELQKIIKATQQEVQKLLESNRSILAYLAQQLLEKETLAKEEIEVLFKGVSSEKGAEEKRGGSTKDEA